MPYMQGNIWHCPIKMYSDKGMRKIWEKIRGRYMDKKERNGFHAVKDTVNPGYEEKIKIHRRKILIRTLVVTGILALIATGAALFLLFHHYQDYEITDTVERADAQGTRFEEFCGNILKYSNDGAFYTNSRNDLIWNQTYEMSDPRIAVCGNYLTIYDRKGTLLYILTPEGLQGSIETTMEIEQVCVASQGTVAVLMQKESTSYLALYDRNGNNLAQGAIHGEKGGYPIAIALSYDAVKLAVSMLDFNDGNVKTTIAFYHFGSVGQNVTDHLVGATSFSDMVVPEMKFLSNNRMIALADAEIMIFDGAQNPQLSTEIPLTQQAKSIFYDEKHIGVVTVSGQETLTHHLTVYDMNGKASMEQDFEMDYTAINFLSNGEVCIRNTNSCDIYTSSGIYKFHSDFDGELFQIFPGRTRFQYTFILNGETQNVRLK